jgi:protein TonB
LGAVLVFAFAVSCAGGVDSEKMNAACKPGVLTFREAMALRTVSPFYPSSAKRKGIEGWVEMEADVKKDGRVTNVRVLDSTPPDIFDSSAVAAFSTWIYCPAETGVSYDGPVKARLEFRLE